VWPGVSWSDLFAFAGLASGHYKWQDGIVARPASGCLRFRFHSIPPGRMAINLALFVFVFVCLVLHVAAVQQQQLQLQHEMLLSVGHMKNEPAGL